MALNVPVIVQLCLIFLVAILYLYHLFRLRYNKFKSKYENKKQKMLIYLTYISGPITLLIYFKDIIFYSINIITKPSCTFSLTLGLFLFTAHKLIIYLYIAIRSQIISKATHFKEYSIWYKIALCLIFSYILQPIFFIILLLSNLRTVSIFHSLCLSDALFDIAMWQMSADIIIGSYCLLVLIYPLRKILNKRQKQHGELPHNIKTIVNSIIKYSFIAIIASILTYPLIFMFIQHSSILVSLELLITNYCIIMQLPGIDLLNTPFCKRIILKLRRNDRASNPVHQQEMTSVHRYNEVQTHTNSENNKLQLEDKSVKSEIVSMRDSVITSTNITNKINNTHFPQFRLNIKYVQESEKIFVILMKLKIIISIDNISQIISEYAATVYRKCSECRQKYGYVECFDDYFIVNNALANCDPLCDDDVRYYLDCDPSFSTIIQNNINYYDENVNILCVECAEKWKCTICCVQFLSYSYHSLLVLDGCDICKCIMCEDCGVLCKDKVLCPACYPDVNSNQSTKHNSVSKVSNNVSKWGSFGF